MDVQQMSFWDIAISISEWSQLTDIQEIYKCPHVRDPTDEMEIF